MFTHGRGGRLSQVRHFQSHMEMKVWMVFNDPEALLKGKGCRMEWEQPNSVLDILTWDGPHRQFALIKQDPSFQERGALENPLSPAGSEEG